ncbi:MAG: diadenylate cyclase CdaA [Spirochaetaceae bacterium]|nr:diadenylate cyclase CdaA [Spirochaetaceae bacterium]
MAGLERLLRLYGYIRPVFDIGLLAFCLYHAYGLLLKTNGTQIIRALIILILAYAVALFLDLTTVMWLLNLFAPGLLIGFAIVFQPELRKIFLHIGQGRWFPFGRRSAATDPKIEAILTAAELLSAKRRGMLVVFVRNTDLTHVLETGTPINADLSSDLLETIFAFDTALHDGAVLIKGNKLLGAGCKLPNSEQHNIKKSFGTRHRAALGISEQTDAAALIVSEETGAISLAYDSKLYYDLSIEQISKTLKEKLDNSPDSAGLGDDKDITGGSGDHERY